MARNKGIGKKLIKREEHKEKKKVETKPLQSASDKINDPSLTYKPNVKYSTKGIRGLFESNYKVILWVPFIILLLAIAQIAFQSATTGEFMNRGVSLKGGLTLTILNGKIVDFASVEAALFDEFGKADISVRELTQSGTQVGMIIEASSNIDQDSILAILTDFYGPLSRNDYNIEMTGSSLGDSFFKETLLAMLIAFLFMGVVVFVYFRTLAPSLAVILCAASDIIVTLAVVNIFGIKLSTGGIAAFLMLIGYSVDTDILLSTKMMKTKESNVMSRVYTAMKTGVLMTGTTLAAVSVALIFTESDVLRQIMTIILIGLVVDLIFTWLQNVGILRLHLERKGVY